MYVACYVKVTTISEAPFSNKRPPQTRILERKETETNNTISFFFFIIIIVVAQRNRVYRVHSPIYKNTDS